MKILVYGIGQINFITTLYRGIKNIRQGWQIDIVGLRKLSDKDLFEHEKVFSNFFDTSNSKKSFPLKVFSNPFFYRLLLNRISTCGFSNFFGLLKDIRVGVKIANLYDYHYDVYHFHFITTKNVWPIFFLKSDCKIVCSFWGSDLMRYSDNFDHFIVQTALKRASQITVQSLELKEIILSKYGRSLSKKIHVVQFLLADDFFNRIDVFKNNEEKFNDLIPSTGIDRNKINIMVGHNAHAENQHLEIIEQLKQVEVSQKRQIKVIIPLTYGFKNAKSKQLYLTQLRSSLEGCGFEYFFLENFLDWEALAFLRCNTKILIHLPVSDALSGAATEAMYAGSILITGSWLPYGPFRRAALKYLEVETLTELPVVLDRVIKNISTVEKDVSNNSISIREAFLSPGILSKWVKVYEN